MMINYLYIYNFYSNFLRIKFKFLNKNKVENKIL